MGCWLVGLGFSKWFVNILGCQMGGVLIWDIIWGVFTFMGDILICYAFQILYLDSQVLP